MKRTVHFDHLFYARGVGREQHGDDAEYTFQRLTFMRQGAEAIKPMRVAKAGIANAAKRQVLMNEL
jgi:hypothetical protein